MTGKSEYPALQMRLARLEGEIERAALLAAKADGAARGEAEGRLADLRHRHLVLRARWQTLVGEAPGVWPRVKAEFDLMSDDLSSAIEDFMAWVASDERVTSKH